MRTIRDCNVAVVGGCGFLGSHLVNHLIEDRGCKVLVIDDLSAGKLEFLHTRAEFEKRDIAEVGVEGVLKGAFAGFGAKFVFNYAAMPFVPDSYVHPLRVAAVNFMGASRVINAAQDAGCEAILQVSSAEVYGEGAPSHRKDAKSISEVDEVVPHSSYGISKVAVDGYVQVAWKERKTPCIALRQFNCVGERETHNYIVPEIISQLSWLKGGLNRPPAPKAKISLGNNSRRDFLYAGDAVRLAVELLELGEFGEVYNLGSEESIGIYDLARKIGKLMGFTDVTVEQDPARIRPWEIWHLQSDNSKLYAALGGIRNDMAPMNLDEALQRTINWHTKNGKKWPWEA